MCCGRKSATSLYFAVPDYYLGKPVRVDYVTCVACGLVQQTPVPGDVADFYDDYPVHHERSSPLERAAGLLMRDVYRDASRDAAGSVMLDYGCGNGAYLGSLRGRAFELLGLERDAVQASRVSERLGVPVYGDPEALLRDHRGRVDVLTMHFVLEHVTDLSETFSRVSQLLKPGGSAYIVVPNASSWERRLFGRKWHGLDPPRHISFPDAPAVGDLARRHGMTLHQSRPVAFPNGVAGSIPVVLLGRFSSPLFLACLPLGVLLSRLAPTGCTAFVVVKEG